MITELGMMRDGSPHSWWDQTREGMVDSLAWAYARQGEAGMDSIMPATARSVLYAIHPPKPKASGTDLQSLMDGLD